LLDAIVLVLFDISDATRNLTSRIGSDTFVACLAISIRVAITLAAAKGIHSIWPTTVIAPIDQVLVVSGNSVGVDAIVSINTLGCAGASIDRVVRGVAVPLETRQSARAIVACIAISLAFL
jgi:hypothetical protein